VTPADLLEITVTRKRGDYFWGMLFDGLNNRIFWLAVLIPPVAEGMLHFKRTEGVETATRTLEVVTHMASAAGIVASAVIAIFYFAANLNARAPGHLSPVTYVISPDGSGTRGESTAWAKYRGAIETKGLFVLQQKAGLLQIIPKRDLSTQAIAALRRLLRANLGRRAQVQESAP
jgi:hypothetical protein